MIVKKLFGTAQQEPTTVGVDAAKARIEAGAALLVDVREREEWQAGHVAGATHIPLGTLPGAASSLPKDREMLVICRTGNRSAKAQAKLAQAGFTQVTNVTGGMTAWAEHDLPIVTGEGDER